MTILLNVNLLQHSDLEIKYKFQLKVKFVPLGHAFFEGRRDMRNIFNTYISCQTLQIWNINHGNDVMALENIKLVKFKPKKHHL